MYIAPPLEIDALQDKVRQLDTENARLKEAKKLRDHQQGKLYKTFLGAYTSDFLHTFLYIQTYM